MAARRAPGHTAAPLDSGRFDAVIPNAGIGYTAPRRVETADGLEQHFQVNVLAPYLLTALMSTPDRLVYLSSGMHHGGHPALDDLATSSSPGALVSERYFSRMRSRPAASAASRVSLQEELPAYCASLTGVSL